MHIFGGNGKCFKWPFCVSYNKGAHVFTQWVLKDFVLDMHNTKIS